MSTTSDILTARRVTSSLSRAHQSLGASVLVAETAAGRLREDGEVIEDTLHEHAYELKNGLSRTKLKLVRVRLQELWETYSLFGSVGFFFAVCLYIIMRRTLMLHMLVLWFRTALRGSHVVSELMLARDTGVISEVHRLDDALINSDIHVADIKSGTGHLGAVWIAQEPAGDMLQTISGINIDLRSRAQDKVERPGIMIEYSEDSSDSTTHHGSEEDTNAGTESDVISTYEKESLFTQEANFPFMEGVHLEEREANSIDTQYLGAKEL